MKEDESMSLNLMYITNDPAVARMADANGVDRIFVDMEYIGKSDRQGGMNTVQNRHTIQDIETIRPVLRHAQLLVRCNPIHDRTAEYGSSAEEIDAIVAAGADVIMLPYFKTIGEVQTFLRLVDGRARTMLLVETPEAVACIHEILALDGIDEVFVGLNDLSLGYGMKFMFQLLADGTVERLCRIFREKGLPYGFGGIASIGKGLLPAERVIAEHYRLGSTCAILSRSFCNHSKAVSTEEFYHSFCTELKRIRTHEAFCQQQNAEFFAANAREVPGLVAQIVNNIK